ncbi:unnamed protein product (macronuclear) [Paramecium tetraurelia]|uniref:Chromosome undetermined scaffold_124, whole genome shotgun sequence n=1 Tax=Paramecium tetraurelia TaxID=5888 RepID=A0BS08_PARTE|nr:uncharacterized protein GSPATT00031556001 [Paramecium tetraurelia]XP_001460040.1 uncharacterized protein GSPATT00025377001 [Paramecium tetraurelia]CAK61325.1 unnamed protein product [Paramecium tetraurelia]CAK92643.1 unnamed protein product [Paramecium tetraurelia]|eukprot:XP_001428723.1 hypothetical protein (macronuclear) [Paramecium tetraurelia strain d4-2]
MDSKIIPLQNIDEFKTSILIEERVAILIFTAEWCQPSLNLVTQMKKELDQQRKRLSQQTGAINIFVVDHEKEGCYQIVKQFAPTTLPYVYLFEKGKYIAQFGGLDVFAMNKLIKKALESSRAL